MIGEAVHDHLRAERFEVEWARDGQVAEGLLRERSFDLVVLDLGLPGRDGMAVLRNLRTTGRDPGRNRPATIVVGDAAQGQTYFGATCAKCHSPAGDLKGLATKYPEPRTLQQVWLAGTAAGGRGAAPVAAPKTLITVTLPSGEVVKGEQARLDDFIVSLKLPDGSVRTIPRNGDVPKLEIHDPLQPHRALVPTYTDRDIHNLTAYLVTLK